MLDPDPHPGDELDSDPDSHQFTDGKPKCMKNEPNIELFKGFCASIRKLGSESGTASK
jgi:hypothetical protein